MPTGISTTPPAHPPAPTWFQRSVRIYSLIAAFVGVALFLKAMPQIQAALDENHWDLNVDRLTAQAFLDDYNPFTPEGAARSGLALSGPAGNGHPPTTSFWFLPLGRMDNRLSGNTLGWLSIMLVLLQLSATLIRLRCPAPLVTAWLCLCYLLSCSFMRYHLSVGQISALIGFLFFVAWHAGRVGDDWLAGAALGVACTLKMFPGVMVLLFLISRRWRAVVAASGVYLAVAAYMTAGFGLSSWKLFIKAQKPIADYWMASIQNQSLQGVVSRIFEPVCGPHGPVLFKATVISTSVSLILIGGACWLVRHAFVKGSYDLAYALFVVLSMVTSQWTWEHYSVIYALPVLLLTAELIRWWRQRRARIGVALALAVLVLIVASWQIDYSTKSYLQAAVVSGSKGLHRRLHLYDFLNWGPGFVFLALLFTAVAYKVRSLRRDREIARISLPATEGIAPA